MSASSFFNITNVIKEEDEKNFGPTIIFFKECALELMSRCNTEYAYMSMHSTNLSEDPIGPSSILKELSYNNNAYAYISNFEPMLFSRRIFEGFYNNSFKVRISRKPTFVSGSYLTLLVLSPSHEHMTDKAPVTAMRIINSIRIIYGIVAAGPPVYEGRYDKKKDSVHVGASGYTFPEEVGSGNDISSLVKFAEGKKFSIGEFPLSHDADVLFNRALLERAPETRFLFLWLCFECMVSSKDRQVLFKNELASELLNEEVYRLFRLRCQLTHEGKANVSSDDCISIIWAIRTAICPDKKVRNNLATEYEKWIASQVHCSQVKP